MGNSAYWLTTGVCFVVSVFCSVAEGALLAYSPSRLEERLKDPAVRARVDAYLEQFDRLIFSAIVLNAMSDVALVFACTLGFYSGADHPTAALYALLASMGVVIIGAEVVPRAFASHFADALLPKVLPIIAAADKIFSPITYPLRMLHDWIAGWLGANTRERRQEEIKDEIRSSVLEASREGVLDDQATEMIEAAIEFRDVEVREIMTPRTEMTSLEIGTPVAEAVKVALEQAHSRIPVFEGTRDRIVGVLYAKDLLSAWAKAGAQPRADLTLRSLIRKPYFVPETKLIGELLREFRARKVHIAIVLDEYGGVCGLVTIEDIIEELVGEIDDEYDATEEVPPLKWVDTTTAEVEARLHIDEVNEALDISLPKNGDYETLGGFMFYTLGKVPKKGDKLSVDDADITVIDGDERRINRVRIAVKRKAESA